MKSEEVEGAAKRPVPRRGVTAVLAAFAALSLALAACLDFSTSPDEILYLTFEGLPYPAVVRGDTLRDSTGAAANLAAEAFNARGNAVGTAPIRFYAIDDTAEALDVDSTTGLVVAEGAAAPSVRIIASLVGLQSPPLSLSVVEEPDTLAVVLPLDTISYSFTDTTLNFSDPLTVRVLHNDSTTFYSGVRSWVVRYYLERPSDTVYAALVNDQNRRQPGEPSGLSHIDTTVTDGSAARKLRIRPGPPLATPIDSVIVLAEAKYKGAHIAGSPARIVVYVRQRITP